VWIDGNVVHDSHDVAIEVSGGDIDQVHITNNTILDCHQGIVSEDGRYVIISGNILRGVTTNGIHVDHSVLDPGHDVLIDNNYVEAAAAGGWAGVAVNTVEGCQIKNNILKGKFNNQMICILAADHVVQGNHLYFGGASTGVGIKCDTDSDGATIVNNTLFGFNDSNAGISSNGNDNLTITGNVFDDAGWCMDIKNSTGHHIQGNTWRSSAGGLQMTAVTYSVVEGNAGFDTNYTATDIVEVGACDNNQIKNNHVLGKYSIVVLGASTVSENNTYSTGIMRNKGATASVADGASIDHGLLAAPTIVTVTGSVAGEICTVSGITSAHFHVDIKKNDGTAGTTQTIYWRAEV
jgi:hypothetical protein